MCKFFLEETAMKNKLFVKAICLVLSATLLFGAMGLTVSAARIKDDGFSVPSLDEMKDLVGVLSYEEYRASYSDAEGATMDPPVIDITDFEYEAGSNGSRPYITGAPENSAYHNALLENPENWVNFGDNEFSSVYLPASGSITWNFEFEHKEQAGHYFIFIEYFNCITGESSVSSIERGFKLDGKVPFDEVAKINLSKSWSFNYLSTETLDASGEDDSYEVSYELVKKDEVDENGSVIRKAGYYKLVTTVKDGKKYVSTYHISQDINGNSMAPNAVAYPTWTTYALQDASGYHSGYFNFYLASGSHSITLEAERDPVIIKSIQLVRASESAEIPSYRDLLAEYEANGYEAPEAGSITLEAEFPDMVSDSSVVASNDNTSAISNPISSGSQLYNVIGETSYNAVGQWAAYKFSVTDSGLYNFGMRYKQSALQGMFVCRAVKISGGHYGDSPVAPFKEAYSAEFQYSKSWQSSFISAKVELEDDEGELYYESQPLMFYFEEGEEYTLYLECSLGTLKDYIQRVENTLERINAGYLEILQLTGSDPDKNTNYQFGVIKLHVLIAFLEESQELLRVKEGLEDLCGTAGSHLATLETVARLLDTMGEDDGKKIPENLTTLKSYLGTLGTWINDSKSGLMVVDSIHVIPVKDSDGATNDQMLPKAEANFFQSLWFELRSFFYSFVVDYDQMGLTRQPDGDAPTIDVWLAEGRDQSQVWRTMIDAMDTGFTDRTGKAVALKLVTGGTLLPSILSGKGPDVYLGLGAAEVINYAIRNAIIGVSGNDAKNLTEEENNVFNTTYYTYRNGEDLETTTEDRGEEGLVFQSNKFSDATNGRFADAAMDTITLLDVSYGVPLTMSFAMMFYRMDVLAELGQEIPESWDELLSLLPALQSNNLSMGVTAISALDFMVYQKGGSMWKYTDSEKYDSKYAGARIDLDSNIALEAFDFVCRLYSDYSLPVSFDAANRFRTGEMPIIIGDYSSIYNQLVVFATEIGGLWGFCSLPGSKRADGSFNYDSLAGVSATVLLHGCDDLLASWQFVQWQTSAESQASYGNKMVAIIGPSAKYATANLDAINDLSWTATEKEAITNQMKNMSSIVNYPGSYIIGRYMNFAFLDAVNNDADAIDAMTGYIDAINSEIARKRQEFDLWTPKNSEEEPPEIVKDTTE